MQQFPSLSVIIPSWNQGRFIERTLLSILHQDYPGSVQVIVSDGGSTDETVEVLRRYEEQIEWWSARDKGFVDAVTKGLAQATGEILAVQSSDDYYLPGAFRKMAECFANFPEAGFVSGGEIGIDLQNTIVYANNNTGFISPRTILFDHVPPQHASFVKRELLAKVGGMRLEVDMCADIDMWYRVSHYAPGRFIPDYLAVYQLHPDQRTATSPKWFDNLVRMVETCEQHPYYGQQFRLTEQERRDLYTYWEVNWTGKRDMKEAQLIAMRKLPGLLGYTPRTRRVVLGAAVNQSLKHMMPLAMRQLISPPPQIPTAEGGGRINLDWWKTSL